MPLESGAAQSSLTPLDSTTKEQLEELWLPSLNRLRNQRRPTRRLLTSISDTMARNWMFRGIAADKLGKGEIAAHAFAKWKELKDPTDAGDLREYLPKGLHPCLKERPDTASGE